MKINNEQDFMKANRRLHVLLETRVTRPLSLDEINEYDEIVDALRSFSPALKLPEISRAEQIDQDCKDDLVGMCVAEVVKIITTRNLTAEEQNKVLRHVRDNVVTHWHQQCAISEKDRREREMQEKQIYGFIEQQAVPVQPEYESKR